MIIAGKCNSCDHVETMEQHMGFMKSLFEKLFVKNSYHVVLSKRLSSLGHSLSPSDAKLLVEASIASHDIGKLLFQNSLRTKGTAYLHEVYSVFMLREVAGLDALLLEMVRGAILLHHHAMRSPDIIRQKPRRRVPVPKDLALLIDEYRSLVNQIFGFDVVIEKEGIDCYEAVEKVVRRTIECMRPRPPGGSSTYAGALMILAPLLVVDSIAACVNRECHGDRGAIDECVSKRLMLRELYRTETAFADLVGRIFS